MEKVKPKQKKRKAKKASEECASVSNDIEIANETDELLFLDEKPLFETEIDQCNNINTESNVNIVEVQGNIDTNITDEQINNASVEVAQEIFILKSDELQKQTTECGESSKSVQNVSHTKNQDICSSTSKEIESNNEVTKPSAPGYKELSAMLKNIEILNSVEEKVIEVKIESKTIPFTYEEIENIFGTRELTNARVFASEFESYNIQPPCPTHPLYEALIQYQKARSQMISNQKDISVLASQCTEKQMAAWSVKNRTKSATEKCADGISLSKSYKYIEANFCNNIFTELQKDLNSIRSKSTEIHSLQSHSEHMLKIQVDDLLWTSTVSGLDAMKDALRILFFVVRTSGWGFDKSLRKQLRNWCCLLSENYLKKETSLEGVLYILHHILRLPQGIRWATHLIRCEINAVKDIYKAFCILEAILVFERNTNCNVNTINGSVQKEGETDDAEIVIASEATDDNLWLIVDSDGEGADVEIGSQKKIVLKETDVLGLIRQIPFEQIFRELMVVRNNNGEDVFCGRNIGGGSVLKVFATVRILLNIIRAALISHSSYTELSKELCRIALHSVMYCTDLWKTASCQCEANLIERLSVEYNNIFVAGFSTLECAGSREVSTMFISEIPFTLCEDRTILNIYKKLSDNLIVSDSVWCYYTMVTISNIANARNDEKLILSIVNKLFEIGYCSDFSDLGCGEWARNLCGMTLKSSTHFLDAILFKIPAEMSPKWLEHLPLALWRPQSEDLLHHLNFWKEDKLSLLPYLLKSLDWNAPVGLDLNIQRKVAIFLVLFTERHMIKKTPLPEWVWECILILKLHAFDWDLDLSLAPHPEILLELDTSGKCNISNIVLMLTTSWGHSMPLIHEYASVFLVKLANNGRFKEMTHILYYIMPCLADAPESVGQNKTFKELLSLIFKDEKTWQKMASRLVNKDFPGPNIKLLVNTIRLQLNDYKHFRVSSPTPIMKVWIYWLTSVDNWQSDWIAIYLIDVVLGSCFFHHNTMQEASNIFKSFIQMPNTPKSPTSFGSWLWNNSASSKGLIQCSMEAPYFWHMILWMEHFIIERETGLWQKLIEKLSMCSDNTKTNIDKTFKSIGGTDSSSILVIYRSLQYAISTPLDHPIFSLMWQLFFYLYMDISFLSSTYFQPKPVGPLFFHGLVNSKLLGRAKARLTEAKSFHESKVSELKIKDNETNDNIEEKTYHSNQMELMGSFFIWLDESFFEDFSRIHSYPYSDKLSMLMSGRNDTWIDTINVFEFKKLQPSNKPTLMKKDSFKSKNYYSLPSSLKDTNMPDSLLPDERVVLRIKTYEKPLTVSLIKYDDTSLEPIIDPIIIHDFYKMFNLLKTNLKEIAAYSRMYCNVCHNLNKIDGDLCKMLPNLYTKSAFLMRVSEVCSATCAGAAHIYLTGKESKLVNNVNNDIDCNRKNHQLSLDNALTPYKNVSKHTAIISKLSSLVCNGIVPTVNDGGVKLFNVVLEAMAGENLQFPPANDVLNTVATQLGEKFVRVSGAHCISLINKMKYVGNEALICSLLRPLELSTSEMLNMYKIVNSVVTDMHVAFSCLSKFRISAWLRDVRPDVSERSTLLTHICEALTFSGCDTPSDRVILQELLCVHLSHVLAWEFPTHLDQVLNHFHAFSIDKKLPPDCWEHCFAVIEQYPHTISHQQASANMEVIGNNWWIKRGTWGLHGLYDRYSVYTSSMARLGALLTSINLNTAMIQQPLLLTHQISSVVFNSMCEFWNVWLVPRWDSVQSVWSNSSPPLMPWGPTDNTAPEAMLDAFVETTLYCIETLPGSKNDFLRLVWHWYFNNFPHISVGSHVLTRVHKSLLRLPWSRDPDHWITFTELQTMSKICSSQMPSSHSFTLQCLGNRLWQSWIHELHPTYQANALHLLLLVLFKLRPEQQVLDDAYQLPWGLLKIKSFEEIVTWCINNYSTTETFCNDNFFPILCAAGGLRANSDYTVEWQFKRISLIKDWVNNLSTIVENKNEASQKIITEKNVGSSILKLLKSIEITVVHLGANETEKLSECVQLLNTAIMMLNMSSLQEIGKSKWIEWISEAPKLCVASLVGSVLNVTQKTVFSSLAEHILTLYFDHGGEWNHILGLWKNNTVIPVLYLLDNNAFLSAFATYKSLDMAKYNGKVFESLDRHIIHFLHNLTPSSSFENHIVLWIFYMISTYNSSYTNQNRDLAYNLIASTLEKWSEEPGIWKTYVKNTAPSSRFRIITKCAYCCITSMQIRCSPNTVNNNIYKRFLANLESLVDQKQLVVEKAVIMSYLDNFKRTSYDCQNISQHLLKRTIEFCISSLQYSYPNYLTTVPGVYV